MANKHIDDQRQRMMRSLSPAVKRFSEYAAGELWTRIKLAAVDDGLTALEAEVVAGLAVKSLIRAMANGFQQAKLDRYINAQRR